MSIKNTTILLLIVSILFSKEVISTNTSDFRSLSTGQFDANRIHDDLENNGMIVSHRLTGHSGMEWPAGENKYSNFASGVWFAGIVNGEIRTAVAEYGPEFVSGPWGSDPLSNEHKLYKVNYSDLNDPAFNDDFQNWPTDLGAPWVDNNSNGIYEPLPNGPDHPHFIGEQVIWYVMNDGDVNAHTQFGSEPLGLEVRVTLWGNNNLNPTGDMMFIKLQAFNKGGNEITDMYIGLWDDPDLGNAGDDFVGCDTTLSLGYCYNDGSDSYYGAAAPAIGYDFFQAVVPSSDPTSTAFAFGKVLSGYEDLPMSSFVKYINGDGIYYDPSTAFEAYNYMSGLKADGTAFINSATSEESKFVHPCDPNDNVDGNDDCWVDSDDHASGDRRFLMNVGPFDFGDGDSTEVIYAIMHAQGSTSLNSVTELKNVDQVAQLAFDSRFILNGWDQTISFISEQNANVLINAVINYPVDYINVSFTDYADNIVESFELYDDGLHSDELSGDLIYGNSLDFERTQQPLNVTAVLSLDGELIELPIWDSITSDGPITANQITVVSDENEDYLINPGEYIHLNLSVINDCYYEHPGLSASAVFSGPVEYAEKVIQYLDTNFGGNNFGTEYNYSNELSYMAIKVSDNAFPGDEIIAGISIFDEYGNFWYDEYILIVSAFEESPFINYVEMEHIAGNSSGTFGYHVYQPSSILSGHTYEMIIYEYLWDPNQDSSQTTIIEYNLNESRDCSGSTITAGALAIDENNTIDLRFLFDMDCGDNWVDGIVIDFPDDMTINSWDAVVGCSYPDSGQNCVNMDGTLDASTNTITWGDNAASQFGAIQGGQVLTVNCQAADLPITGSYIVYDDGYDGTIVDGSGSYIIDQIHDFEDGVKLYTLIDITTYEIISSSNLLPADNYALNIPLTDGFKIVKGTVSYDVLPNYISITIVGGGTYDIGSYYDYGWAQTAMSVDTYGSGTTDWGLLSRDVKVVWDGVYGDPDANGFVPVVSGGSKAWIYGARNDMLENHPSPENPGTGEPFLITVPFKVYDIESGDEPEQISIIIYDRIQYYDGTYDGNGDGIPEIYAFNPYNRMYTEFVNRPYEETLPDFTSNEAYLTWNVVWWEAAHVVDDEIIFEYGAPLTSEDRYQFTPSEQNPPTAQFEIISSEVIYGTPVIFDASSSYDPDGEDLSFSWSCNNDFNDPESCYIESSDNTASIEFFRAGHHTITMIASDAAFDIPTSQEVIVKPKLDNIDIEWTYLDSSWVQDETLPPSFNSYITGDTLIIYNQWGRTLKIYKIEYNNISHQADIPFEDQACFSYWDNNRLFIKKSTDLSPNACTGTLNIYDVAENWQLTPVLENYSLPVSYSDCIYCNQIISTFKIDQEWYFKDYHSIYRMDLSDPSNPQVLAQKNYESSNSRPYVYDAGGDYIYVKYIDYASEVFPRPAYIDVLDKLTLDYITTLDIPDSLLSVGTTDDLLITGFDGYASIYYISNPLEPQYISEISIPIPVHFEDLYYNGNRHSIGDIGNNLITITVGAGKYLYNLEDPSQPLYHGSWQTGGSWPLGWGLPSFQSTDNDMSYYAILDGYMYVPLEYYDLFHVGFSKISIEGIIDLLGDVNNDGYINILDVVQIVNVIVGNSEFTSIQMAAADFNQDGTLDILDVVQLVNYIMEYSDELLSRSESIDALEIGLSSTSIYINAEGGIGGVQINTEGDYTITEAILPEGWEHYSGPSGIVLLNMTGKSSRSEVHLGYTGDLKIIDHLVSDLFGNMVSSSISAIPDEYSLNNAYPNPFNPTTTLNFAIPVDSEVSLSIYNLQGREVSTLIDKNMDAGYHSVIWNANSYASGVYFVKMVAGNYVNTQKLMLVK